MPLTVKSRASRGAPSRSVKSKLLAKNKVASKKVKTPEKKTQKKTLKAPASKKRKLVEDEEDDFEDYEGDADFNADDFAGFSKADIAKLNHIPDGEDDSEEEELRAALAEYAKEQGLSKDGDEEDEEEDEGEYEEGEGDELGEDFDEQLAALDDEDPFGEGEGDDDEFSELYEAGGDEEEDEEEEELKKPVKKATKKQEKETLKRKRSVKLEDVEQDFESDEEGTGVWDAEDLNLDEDGDGI